MPLSMYDCIKYSLFQKYELTSSLHEKCENLTHTRMFDTRLSFSAPMLIESQGMRLGKIKCLLVSTSLAISKYLQVCTAQSAPLISELFYSGRNDVLLWHVQSM